jgi:hypothetical protein
MNIEEVLAKGANPVRRKLKPLLRFFSQDDPLYALHDVERASHDRWVFHVDKRFGTAREGWFQGGQDPEFPAHVMRGLCLRAKRRSPQHKFSIPHPDEISEIGVPAGELTDRKFAGQPRDAVFQELPDRLGIQFLALPHLRRFVGQIHGYPCMLFLTIQKRLLPQIRRSKSKTAHQRSGMPSCFVLALRGIEFAGSGAR